MTGPGATGRDASSAGGRDTPILGLDHVQIAAPAGCEAAARAFYGDLLGLAEVPKPAQLAGAGGVWFRLGAQQLHVGVEAEFAPARKAHPALKVRDDDLDRLADRLAEAGVRLAWDRRLPLVRRFYADDPWGNRLELLA
ncbi:MAG TPA: VOC family protein [Solirubrobacteraceae bacterium]|jgi:catechol 2,3-dioxygenase-like lactoylglutathione lyase family enzyme|nr:VOC family protein [Solirubrobacteraceae bacterium]